MEPSNLIPHLRIICNMNASITEFSCVLYSEKSQQWDSKREGVKGGRFGHVSTASSAKVRSCACIRFVQTHTYTRSRRWGERKRQVIRITLGLQRFTLKERRTKGHSIFFLLKDLRLLNYYSWAGKGTNLSFSLFASFSFSLYFFFFFFFA